MLKRMIYGQMAEAINKKATKNLKKPFKCKEVQITGFHAEDIIYVTASDGAEKDTQKLVLSEHTEQLDMFLNQIKGALNNHAQSIKTVITLDLVEKTEEVNEFYSDQEGVKHNFKHKEKY